MPLWPTEIRNEPKGYFARFRRKVRRSYDRIWWEMFIISVLLTLKGSRRDRK